MAGEGITLFLCATCEGEVRETTGFYNTGNRVVRNSRRCECCNGQPFRGCPDRKNFHVDGKWIGEIVDHWLSKADFRLTLERNPTMSQSEIGMLRYRLGGDHLGGAKFWAFSQAIYKLQRDLEYLGDFQRITGAPASDHVMKLAMEASKTREK